MHVKIILFTLFVLTRVTSAVRLVGHGYENIVVGISPYIREHPKLLAKIESIFTEASITMFQSTKNRIYIKEVIIAIPKDWQTRKNYENAADLEIEHPDVRIAKSNQAYGDTPYVRGYRGCGLPARYIHLTTNYILKDEIRRFYGSPGKLIVHEWGHFRWGLFDEYPVTDDEGFYLHEQKWHPTRCSTEVDGKLQNRHSKKDCKFDFNTGKPELNCQFLPSENNKAISSLMFMQFLENIIEFCDDPSKAPEHLRHNKLAPNRQNKLCNYQSAWEIMRNHTDFISTSSMGPLSDTIDIKPRFRYIQVQPRKRVLVFDVSESMKEEGRIENLRQAAGNFILSIVETGSWLGIVQFSTRAATLARMTEIASEEDRESLAELLPTAVDDYTSIGAGLEAGLELLSSVGNPAGGSIILVTDGAENRHPLISSVEPQILKKRVVVHAFAYGQLADTGIAELANATGGKLVFYSGSQNSTALIDGLAATVDMSSDMLPSKDVYLSVLTDARIVTKSTPSIGTFYIDSSIGRDAYLTFSYTEPITVRIQNSNGPYEAQKVSYYTKLKIIKVLLGNDVVPGLWSYKVTTRASSSAITVNIQSKPRNENIEVIQVSAWVVEKADITFDPKRTIALYADVMLGKTPVLNASVIATVERPNADSFNLPLYDRGIGSDIIKGDGVYSANIIATDFTGDGRYNIKIKVSGQKDRTRVIVGGQSFARGALQMTDRQLTSETAPLEDFQRVTTAGEFRLKGFTKAEVDHLPPARIMDFHAKIFDAEKGRATLEWTAVGGDMDRGRAFSYIIYVAWDLQSLLETWKSAGQIPEKDVLRGNLSLPLPSGDHEEYIISVKDLDVKDNKTLFLSVVALDESGNEGDISNVITLAQAKELSIGGVLYGDLGSNHILLYILVPLLIGIFVLVVIIILVIRYRRKRAQRETHQAEIDENVRQELREKIEEEEATVETRIKILQSKLLFSTQAQKLQKSV